MLINVVFILALVFASTFGYLLLSSEPDYDVYIPLAGLGFAWCILFITWQKGSRQLVGMSTEPSGWMARLKWKLAKVIVTLAKWMFVLTSLGLLYTSFRIINFALFH